MNHISISPTANTPTARQHRRDIAIYRACHGRRNATTIKRVAAQFDISVATAYRALQRIDRGKPAHTHGALGTTRTWSPEALQYMSGYYLKVLRECGTANKAAAYDATIREAQHRGWRIGSRSSAYNHFRTLSPLLKEYAEGGAPAVDTTHYQPRDYSKLKPLDCIIGDQHRFDYFVCGENGEAFRPECFVWMDAATRSIYGIHCDTIYNKQTVAAALSMGIKRYGLYNTMYTDNGSSELSRHIQEINADLSAYGCTSEIRHIRARVRNAKAKPIERMFRTLETYLDRQCLPGKVRDLGASSAVSWQRTTRLKRQQKQNQLLTIEEFTLALIRALDFYMQAKHSALGMSPLQKLDEFVRAGWRPVRMNDQELDYILLARTQRKVHAGGRLRIAGNIYEAACDEGISALACVPRGTTVTIRYNITDIDTAYAELPPRGEICPLRRIAKLDFLARPEEVATAMGRKRAQINAVASAYKALTNPLPQLLATPERDPLPTQPTPTLTNADTTIDPDPAPPPQLDLDSDHDRYAAHITMQCVDPAFASDYEKNLTHAERVYWEEFKRLQEGGGISP